MASARQIGANPTTHTYGSGGMGRDYTLMNAWRAATALNLVGLAESRHLAIYNDAVFTDNLRMVGATTNATYYRSVGAAAGEEHDGTPNTGVRFLNSTVQRTFRINESFGQIHDIVATNTFTTTALISAFSFSGGGGRLAGCIAHGVVNGGTGGGNGIDARASTGLVEIIDCISIGSKSAGFRSGTAGTTTEYGNCTSVDNGTQGFNNVGGGTATAINCLSSGAAVRDFNGTWAAATKTNASSDATAPGTDPQASQTFTFVDASSDDYHLASGDTGALGFGTDQSADYDDDIDRNTVSTWSIGAHSPSASSSSGGCCLLRRRRR